MTANGFDTATGEPLPTRPYPKFCPMCGCSRLSFDHADWFSHSLEECDLHNTAVLNESQCRNEECGVSFWT